MSAKLPINDYRLINCHKIHQPHQFMTIAIVYSSSDTV